MLSVRTGYFTAQPRRRKHLPRVTQMRGIEGVAYLLHHIEVIVGKHSRHVVFLVRTDTVLASDRAARFDTVGENLSSHVLGQFRLAGNALVVTNQRMQVAIAGMKDVANAQARALPERADAFEHFG